MARDAIRDALRHAGGRGGRCCGQEDHELVAAVAGHDILAAHCVHQRIGYFAKECVAREMAIRVIDSLELIHVQEDDGEALIGSTRADHLLLNPLEEETSIIEPRQRIVTGLALQGVVQLRHLEIRGELRANRRHKGNVRLGKGVGVLALRVEHAHHATAADQRKGELRVNLLVESDVPGLGLHVGDDLGRPMSKDPPGDPLAGGNREPPDIDRIAAVRLDAQLIFLIPRQKDRHHVVAHHVADDIHDAAEQGIEVEHGVGLLCDAIDDAELARIGDAEDVLGAGRHAGRGPYQGIEHSLIPGSLCRRRLPTHGRKGLGQPRIEDDARESGELLQALVHRGFGLEREVESDIEESIDDGDDARLGRNRLTLKPIRVALTVEPLVVCADQWRQVGERRESCQQVRRDAWVRHHQRPLFRVQPAALLQDAVRQAELAQVL